MARRGRLKKYILSKQSEVFSWSGFNCCVFVNDWLKKNGHPDLAADYHQYVTDKITAAGWLRKSGIKLIRNLPKEYLKLTTRPRVGDIALGVHQYNLGIYAGGGYSYFLDGQHNCIKRLSNKFVNSFWRID